MGEFRQRPRQEDPPQPSGRGKREKASRYVAPSYMRQRLGEGAPMASEVRGRMEEAFGTDFSAVRVHTGAQARKLTSPLAATAATLGDDIAFAPGAYRPGTPLGDALIAHELAHVVQQRGAAATTPQGLTGESDSALEAEADRSAAGVVARLWGGAKNGASRLGRALLPTLRGGLRIQRCKQAPAWSDADWAQHAATLRQAAGGTIGDEQEALFIAAFNDAMRGLDLPMISGKVEKFPGKDGVRPGRIYFDKEFTATPAVTRAVYGYGPMRSTTYSPRATQEGSVIVLGPKAIMESRAYTQSVIRHEHLHMEQNRAIIENGTTQLSEPDNEVPAYVEQLRHIHTLTSDELKAGVLRPLLGYYADASPAVRSRADTDAAAHIAANLPRGPRTRADVLADLRTVRSELRAGTVPGVPAAKASIAEAFLNPLIAQLSSAGGAKGSGGGVSAGSDAGGGSGGGGTP